MRLDVLAWLGSVGAMLGALFFQYGMGLDPCVLCIYQRLPHIAVIVLGAVAIWLHWKWAYPILGIIILIGAGIAFFHVGVEQKWWEGLASCSADVRNLSIDDLLAKPPARCDEVAWSLFGLSMAAWNGIASVFIAVLWFVARKR